jgi:hypothetical protein
VIGDNDSDFERLLVQRVTALAELVLVQVSKDGNRLARIREELAKDPHRPNGVIAAQIGGRRADVLRLIKLVRLVSPAFPPVPMAREDDEPGAE